MSNHEYYTIFSFYLKERKMFGKLTTLYPIDEHYPLHFYIQNAVNSDDIKDIQNIQIYKDDKTHETYETYDLYIIDNHHRYYQYIYQQKKGVYYYLL